MSRQYLAFKWYLGDVGLLLWSLCHSLLWSLLGIMYKGNEHPQHIYKSIHCSLQFTAPWCQVSCLGSRFLADFQATSGNQVVTLRCRLATIVLDWHFMDAGCITRQWTPQAWLEGPLYFYSPMLADLIFCRLSGNVWPSSGGMPSCRCYNSGWLALYGCITVWWTLSAWL